MIRELSKSEESLGPGSRSGDVRPKSEAVTPRCLGRAGFCEVGDSPSHGGRG